MQATSRDQGRSFTPPAYATYRPGGRRIKHPLACPPVWRLRDGRFLLWHHNHGGRGYEGRNPAWLSGGVERDGAIHWSEPEIALYDHDPTVRISYPDLIEEEDGTLYLTETQKKSARSHRLDRALIDGLFRQHDPAATGPGDAHLRLAAPGSASWQAGRSWSESGLSLVFDVEMPRRAQAGPLVAWEHPEVSLGVNATAHGSFALAAPGCGHAFAKDQVRGWGRHRVALILDARARRGLLVVDGELVDGGHEQQHGTAWLGFLRLPLDQPATVRAHERVSGLALWGRALSVSEAVLLTRPTAR
jgi:hypothetical protein